MTVRDVMLINQERVESREPRHVVIACVIVEVSGSTSPSNRPNMVYVKEMNRPESRRAVWNTTTLKTAGTPVKVEIDPNSQDGGRVIGIYDATLLPTEAELVSRGDVGVHAPNHQMPSESNVGPDPVLVYQPAVQPLKTAGDGATLVVTTQELIYNVEGTRKFFEGVLTDLSSYVPSTVGRALRVLLYLDVETNLREVLVGAEVVNSGAIPIPYPKVPQKAIPSAYVKLVYGQTAVTTATDVDDARSFYSSYGNYSFPLSPTEDGQIIIVQDGEFALGVPMVDIYGDIMTNSDGTILTG